MPTTAVHDFRGRPAIWIDGQPRPPVIAYVGPDHAGAFLQAGIELYTFYVPGEWWLGPERYDFSGIQRFIGDYIGKIPGGYFMPRIDLARQGVPWWSQAHPDEMVQVRGVAAGEPRPITEASTRAADYLGHDIRLEGLNLHSFHSHIWRAEAGRAAAALVAFCEAQPYAERIWAWQFCDGLFCEWFHWHEYSFDGMADYSPAALADFRAWLRREYGDAAELSRAWGREVDFTTAMIPAPRERMNAAHDEFYDPVRDRPTIDYARCFNDATADSLIAIFSAVKAALPQPKATCAFYGYQFSNMPRPQLNGHYSLQRVLASPAIDMIASPHAYSNRGHGGYHSPQAVADAIRRAGKLHIDEVDCKTVWTPASVTWKRHISQPQSVPETIEMLKKDAAYQLASGTALWWMDLTDQGWFDDPDAVEPLRRLHAIAAAYHERDIRSYAEVALVVSQQSMMYQAPREGLHNATLKMFRNWHLGRMGAPFEQIFVDDLERPDLPAYRLYIMANLFYVSERQRELIERVVKRQGATALWIYAPGFLDDGEASLERMHALTGIRFGRADIVADLNVRVTPGSHPIVAGLPADFAYGTGIDREQYLQPPRTQYLPTMTIGPAFYADDPAAEVLGIADSTGRAGLVVKNPGDWHSIYSAAPLLPWPLLRNIARFAGAHVFDDDGDMVWGNDGFLAVYAQHDGRRIIRFPHPADIRDAYTGELLGRAVDALELEMARWQTRLLDWGGYETLPIS